MRTSPRSSRKSRKRRRPPTDRQDRLTKKRGFGPAFLFPPDLPQAGLSMASLALRRIMAVGGGFEQVSKLRMPHRFARLVGKQILLRDIGDVFRLVILREQVVVGLVLAG